MLNNNIISEITNQVYIFFLLSILTSALMVIVSKNPVYSIFFLILVFLNTAMLLVLLGAEFLAILILIVYVGAVAVLFLFVIMMLNINLLTMSKPDKSQSTISFLVIFLFTMQLINIITNYFYFGFHHVEEFDILNLPVDWSSLNFLINNVNSIGVALFVYYSYSFILISLLLLLSMIGAIILTLDHILKSKKQLIFRQVTRSLDNCIIQYSIKNKK